MTDFTRNPKVILSTQALQHNLARVKQFAPKSKVLAMVKANAYGHGVAFAIDALKDADAFGVACMREAREIRALGNAKKIVLIEGVCSAEEWLEANQNHSECVIAHKEQLHFATTNAFKGTTVWLKMNSGMNRLGFKPEEAIQAATALFDAGYQIILTSHFANADEPEHPLTTVQIDKFVQTKLAIEKNLGHPIQASMANSAAIINLPNTHGDWVRPGIMLYGSSPFAHLSAADLYLKPTMTFNTTIIAKHQIEANQSIGYGSSYTTTRPMVLGVIAMGYGDGYPRVIQNGIVSIHNLLCPILGRVSMDLMVVDLTALESTNIPAQMGDVVELWGNHLTVEQVATSANTISYELYCRLSQRPERIVAI